jgi:mannosyltransferase
VNTSLRDAVNGTTLVLAALTVAAAALRFPGIGHQSYWYDEGYSVVLVHHSPGQMLGLLPTTENTPPLYYCVLWVWAHIFGYGEAAMRSLSALAGVATVPAIYAAGSKLVSRRAGLIAAALVACNPLLIWYSQEARSYALLLLLVTLSLLAFAHARSPRPSNGVLVAWALAASLTLATHYFGVLAVIPESLWLLWVHRRDRRVLVAVGTVGAVGLALLPLAITQRTNAVWIARYPFDRRLGQIAPQLLLGTGAPARTVLKVVGAAAVVLAATLFARRADASERAGALVAGALAASGFLLALALVLVADELITRNVMVILIPMIVLVAGGLGARRAGALGIAGAATLCTVGIIAAVGVAADWRYQRPDWRGLAATIGVRSPAGAGRAILMENYERRLPLEVYMPGLRYLSARGAAVHELDVVAVKSPGFGWFCWWGSACNLVPSQLDTAIRIPGFRADRSIMHAGQFSILRLRSAGAARLTLTEVSRALRGAGLRAYGLLLLPAARGA